jgi:hypothetical protein
MAGRANPEQALSELRGHAFGPYHHGARPALLDTWIDAASVGVAQREKGRPLTFIERKHVKYDPANAPPLGMAGINR